MTQSRGEGQKKPFSGPEMPCDTANYYVRCNVVETGKKVKNIVFKLNRCDNYIINMQFQF